MNTPETSASPQATLDNAWLTTVELNRAVWTEKAENCQNVLEPSSAHQDILPPRVFRRNNQGANGEEEEVTLPDEEPERVVLALLGVTELNEGVGFGE